MSCTSITNIRICAYVAYIEFEIQYTSASRRSDSYLDPFLDIDTFECVQTRILDEGDGLNFPTVNVLIISKNISPSYRIVLHISISFFSALANPHYIRITVHHKLIGCLIPCFCG